MLYKRILNVGLINKYKLEEKRILCKEVHLMIRGQTGAAKVPIIFLVLIVICVVGLAVIMQTGPPETTVDNVTDNQQAGPENFTEDFTGDTLSSLEDNGWSVWYKPSMPEVLDNSQVGFTQETVSVTENETLKAEGAGGLAYYTDWSDYTLTFNFRIETSLSSTFWLGLAFRCDNTWTSGTQGQTDTGSWPQNSYIVQLGFETNRLWKIVGGEFTQLDTEARSISSYAWHDVEVKANGSSLEVYLDDNLLLSATDSDLTSGSIGLLNCKGPVYFDNVLVEFPTT